MTRLSALAAITTVASSDILHVASDPGGANLDKKITVANFILSAGVIINAPATSAKNTIQPSDAAVVPMILKGAVSQSADLFQIQNSSGTVLMVFDSSARLGIGGATSPQARLHIQPTADAKGAIIQAFSGQTANILEIQNSSAGNLLFVSAGGYLQPVGIQTGYRTSSTESAIYGAADTFNSVSGMYGSLVLQSRSDAARPIIFVTGSTPTERLRIDGTGVVTVKAEDATTNGVTNALTLAHNTSSGAGATGLGTGIAFNGETSTTADTLMGRVRSEWIVATHASRQSKLVLSAVYSGGEIFVAEFASTSGGFPQIGLGTAVNSGYFLNISNSLTSVSGVRISTTSNSTDLAGVSLSASYNGTSGNSYGIQSTLYDTGTTGVLLVAAQNTLVKNNVASALATGVATDSVIQVAGASSGNITAGIAVRARFILGGAGSVPTAYGFQLTAPSISSTGTITTLYGIHMAASQITGVTTFVAILTNDGQVIFNEGGDAAGTFRVEGDTDPFLLYTAASTDRVAIGTSAPGYKLSVTQDDAITNSVVTVLALDHSSTGTPANGHGSGMVWLGESSTTLQRIMVTAEASYIDVTDASRKSKLTLSAWDTSKRVGIEIEASGSAPKLGFFGVSPVVRPSAYTPTNVSTDRSYDANATTLDELADVVGTLIADLQALGLIG